NEIFFYILCNTIANSRIDSEISTSSSSKMDYLHIETRMNHEASLSAQNQEQQLNFTSQPLREQQEFTQPQQHLEQNSQEQQLTENSQENLQPQESMQTQQHSQEQQLTEISQENLQPQESS